MRAVDIIRKKRDGQRLSDAEIDAFIQGVTNGDWPDYQASALLMAIVLRGMDADETAALTRAMTNSGTRLDLSDIPGPKIDKHSTGGVGDKTSLILAPLLACCGIVVPMMSGRGLGHTGGTLDKLEAIPGFRVNLSEAEFRAALKRVGCAMIGQTSQIAPADKILYALRDVTGTVESIPLITASIMSKKLAEGIDGLVLDVKCGRGAFMKTASEARALAESLCRTGAANELRTVACVTAMDAPLGRAVGNALEIIEAIETLKGRGPADLERLCLVLGTHMLRLGGFIGVDEEAETKLRAEITSGRAVEKFRAMVAEQGGDPRVVDNYALMRTGPGIIVWPALRNGYVAHLDAERVGRAAMVLGAGRNRVSDRVDHRVGVTIRAQVGDAVKKGTELATVHCRSSSEFAQAMALLRDAWTIEDAPPPSRPFIQETITL